MQYFEFLVPYLVGFGAMAIIFASPRIYDKEWAIIPGVLMGIWLLVTGIVFFETLSGAADLKAFQNETLAAYEYTADETKQIVLTDDALTDFSDQVASDRIAELRDRVAWYNRNLARYRVFEDLPIIGAIIADVDEDLEPIALGK